MLLLSHTAGSDSSTFAHHRSTHFSPTLEDKGKDKSGDVRFESRDGSSGGGSGGSGEVKVGLEENLSGYTLRHQGRGGQGAMEDGDMRQWRDEDGELDEEEEDVDDGGDGWYEKAMEIIRQDALIQEQVLAATLL
jgi:hypothetical protein